ncbi:transposase family protein, partial [Sphaerospermopsis reniformis]|uniref:transposase family protein n=1 Tax=Sphaerospermopsis reniformis TaxID=531300 RepID=UPI0027D9485A
MPSRKDFLSNPYIGGDNMTTPQKKTKNKELTDEQKEANKKLSSKRIFVEHIIR